MPDMTHDLSTADVNEVALSAAVLGAAAMDHYIFGEIAVAYALTQPILAAALTAIAQGHEDPQALANAALNVLVFDGRSVDEVRAGVPAGSGALNLAPETPKEGRLLRAIFGDTDGPDVVL